MPTFKLATEKEVRSEIIRRLRAHRLAKGLSQVELAHRAGISAPTYQRLESSADGSFENLIRAIMALGLVGELEGLFELKPQSIAQMEILEKAKRQRAPRQPRKAGP